MQLKDVRRSAPQGDNRLIMLGGDEEVEPNRQIALDKQFAVCDIFFKK
ncbi:MAG: hypothetical protein JSW39_08120 [Desulfobacterales bacterium]|nr:MAG: hypothetical protein JSW39_08120 [Desulfobacterales bacterium]